MNLKERIEEIVVDLVVYIAFAKEQEDICKKYGLPYYTYHQTCMAEVVESKKTNQATTDILKAFVDHCEDFLGKEDSDEYPGEGEYYNKAIQDIIEDMKERIG